MFTAMWSSPAATPIDESRCTAGLDDQLSGVFAREQHAQCARRIFQPIDDMQPLLQAAPANLSREPGASLGIPVMIIENEEVSDGNPPAAKHSQIANTVRL